MRRLVPLLVGAVLALTLLAIPQPAQAVKPWEYQQQAVGATNNRRADHGRVRLRVNACLKQYAVGHAQRMARERRMYHQPLRPVLRRCGMSLVGENVARGYRTGWAVVNSGWMRSPTHRANLLNPRHRIVAVGARRAPNGVWYASQLLGVRR